MARPDIERRRADAYALHLMGTHYRAIAVTIGVSHTQAIRDVRAAIAASLAKGKQAVEAARRRQLDRLREIIFYQWERLTQGDAVAARTILRCLEREAKLLGLDAPAKVNIEASIRAMAVAEGFDPDECMRTAEQIIKGTDA